MNGLFEVRDGWMDGSCEKVKFTGANQGNYIRCSFGVSCLAFGW